MSTRLQAEAAESFDESATTRFHEHEWCRDLTDEQSTAPESAGGAFVQLAPSLSHDSSRRQFARETLSFAAGRSVRDSARAAESWPLQAMIAMAGSAAAAQKITVESARFEAKSILRAADAGAEDLRLWLTYIEFEDSLKNHVRAGSRKAQT